jgi:hypothetical protein
MNNDITKCEGEKIISIPITKIKELHYCALRNTCKRYLNGEKQQHVNTFIIAPFENLEGFFICDFYYQKTNE